MRRARTRRLASGSRPTRKLPREPKPSWGASSKERDPHLGKKSSGKVELELKPQVERPRFYGGGPVQHVPLGRSGRPRRGTARVRARRSSGPPVALLVGAPVALVLLLILGVAMSGGDDPPPARRGNAAPAATARPAPPPTDPAAAPSVQPPGPAEAQVDRPAPAPSSDLDNEETEEEARARLEAVDRLHRQEQEWVNGLSEDGEKDEPSD